MKTNEYILMCMDRVKNMLYASLQGLTMDQVCKKPESESNHIAWIVWHMTRGFDRRVSMMVNDDQIWILEKWYKQYNLPRSDKDLGIGHTSDDVNKIVPKSVGILLGYYESVNKRMLKFFLTNESENYQNPYLSFYKILLILILLFPMHKLNHVFPLYFAHNQ